MLTGAEMELQHMPEEQAWKPAQAMEFEKENSDTPSKRAAHGGGAVKSPASVRASRAAYSLPPRETVPDEVMRQVHRDAKHEALSEVTTTSHHNSMGALQGETSKLWSVPCRTPSGGR